MNKIKIALLVCAAAAPLPALAQAAPPVTPLGFFELDAEIDGVLAGVAGADFTSVNSVAFSPAVLDDPLTVANEAKPVALDGGVVGSGRDATSGALVMAKASGSGTTTISAAVLDDPDTLVDEGKPAVASRAVTETNAALNSGGVAFSKYTGVATCSLDQAEEACTSADYDVTAFVGSTEVTADGVAITNGTKTVSLTSNGLDNGGNILAGVADGVADTDAVNRRQLNSVSNGLAAETASRTAEDALLRSDFTAADTLLRTDFTAADTLLRTDFTAADTRLRTDLTTETNSRIAADTALRNDLTAETSSRIAADNVLRDQIASSTATAIALGGAVILPDVNFSLSGNVGFYEGATALALNAAARVAPNTYVTGAIGGGLNKNGAVGGRVGFALGF